MRRNKTMLYNIYSIARDVRIYLTIVALVIVYRKWYLPDSVRTLEPQWSRDDVTRCNNSVRSKALLKHSSYLEESTRMRIRLSDIYVDETAALVFCAPATSGFERFYRQAGGIPTPVLNPNSAGRVKLGQGIKHLSAYEDDHAINALLLEYDSVILVRHPFANLWSAYARYVRGGCRSETVCSRILTHLEVTTSGYNITFREFVTWFTSTNQPGRIDSLWSPQSLSCLPRLVAYKRVLRYETWSEDFSRFSAHIGAKERTSATHWPRPLLGDAGVVRRYYSDIRRADVQKIFRIYNEDMYLFGYNITQDVVPFCKYVEDLCC